MISVKKKRGRGNWEILLYAYFSKTAICCRLPDSKDCNILSVTH